MEWVAGMNRAINYIEDNLAGQVDQTKAARIAACSEFHFQRMFAFIAGVTVSEYIRRRPGYRGLSSRRPAVGPLPQPGLAAGDQKVAELLSRSAKLAGSFVIPPYNLWECKQKRRADTL